MLVEQQFSLQLYNTLGLPSTAKFCVEVSHSSQLPQVIALANKHSLPVIVLGEGSNAILAPVIDAVVVLMRIQHRQIAFEPQLQQAVVTLGAGESWHEAVCYCLENHCYGLENLALIPGCAGAAPVQNIGAYGRELSDFLLSVTVFNPQTLQLEVMSAEQCQLSYRESIFKQQLRELIIVDITLSLSMQDKPRYGYQALQQQLTLPADEITANDVFDAVVAVRSRKLPNPAILANAGSFFKNPVVSASQYQQLRAEFPQLVGYVQADDNVKLAAGWLIDQAGWRGRSLGPVAMHKEQALVLVNNGGATLADVVALVEQVKADSQKRYGLSLEVEPRWLG
ncbi:UDP-N-acetylenolpyruvoylglucosamine reductase [Sinobacterium norvegicum]|uniref:UDP-N-acetylenolpyruvoylglucosamine reductase n=1 Tax=Sinobacterium norvegicum TaxID=1641715 RepID=A0ABM9A9X4_9GAMM|nr:UDP-N-acetylmuramate dehydrogenase [Sinobacterium norvegicum]CAH0990007.1 UDP-N-acetylenolpyruvoylglucosamine reductase [Sinobacterium norvegicum]